MATRKVLIIAGTGRSGTSWIHDVTTSHYNYRRIFEPLHPGQVPSASGFAGLCLDEADDNEALRRYLDDVFHHATKDGWIRWVHLGITKDTKLARKMLQYVYNSPNIKFWAKYRVVKFIQANMMLSWIAKHFDHPILFVIRNPYSVIRSQLNMGWSHDVQIYSRQENIRKTLLDDKLLTYVNSLSSILERLTARWCIENIVAIRQIDKLTAKNHEVIPITYERLSSGDNLDILLSYLNYSQSEIASIHRNVNTREKLRSSRRKSTKGAGLTEVQKALIQDVLRNFGVASYPALTSSFDKIF